MRASTENDDLLVDRRHAQVFGDGPRMDPLTLEEMPEEALEITRHLMKVTSSVSGEPSLENVPEIVPTMLRHPELFKGVMALSTQLQARGTLTARDRELAILRSAWLSQAPYEWGEHVAIAKQAGVGTDEIERVTRGSSAAEWTGRDRALLQAVEELHDEAMISDATWDALSKTLDEKQLIELPILVGQFQMVAYFQNSLRLRLRRRNGGLRER